MEKGKLLAIWVRKEWGGEMNSLDVANLVKGKGLVEDVSFGGRRQVTVIEEEKWNAVNNKLNSDLPPKTRRANLMISGINLEQSRGKILKIGNCRIEIKGETKPCAAMDEKFPGLKNALKPNWNGGAFGKVLDSGQIFVGDEAVLEEIAEEKI